MEVKGKGDVVSSTRGYVVEFIKGDVVTIRGDVVNSVEMSQVPVEIS